MALSAPGTPRTIYTTPRRLGRQNPPQTPECFSKVTVETPQSLPRRRSSQNKNDQERNLTVAVRIRPMNARELTSIGTTDVVKVEGQDLIITTNALGTQTNLDHIFQYDHIFLSCDENLDGYTNQSDVFNAIGMPLVENAFRGYNACLFAYGQTGSGKSYSMMGPSSSECIDIDFNAGVIPRFCKELFNRISQLDGESAATVEVTYFEIYNEKIHDLLATNLNNQKTALKVREHPVWGPYVVDLSVHTVKSYKELRGWLLLGNKNRATAATAMNEKSSRSHSIFSIEICLSDGTKEDDSSRRSKISLVDLAGSERLSNSMNNEERLRQGVSINKSLLTLGKVISALAELKRGQQYVPYRDSVLTWLLRESLGGNSLTSMLATITPASTNVDETLATLRYACQARSIINRARINENAHDKLIRELRAEVVRLRAIRKDYERNSINGSIDTSDSVQCDELKDLRDKLSATEEQLLIAQRNWELRFTETKRMQEEELIKAEKRKEELESRIRVMKNSDRDVNLSPFQSNFLDDLEEMLGDCTDKVNNAKVLKQDEIVVAMKRINEIFGSLRSTVNECDDNVKTSFSKMKKSVRAFESSLLSSLRSKKCVSFKAEFV